VKRGQRVLIALVDRPELISVFLGAIRMGAVPVPFNPEAGAEELAFVIADSGAPVVILGEAALGRLRPLRARLRRLRHVATFGVAEPPELDWAELTRSAPSVAATAPVGPDDPCFWVYTVGTSGIPYAAVHRQRDMRVCVEQWARPVLGMSPADVVFSAAKLFTSYGLGNSLFHPLGTGATTVLMEEPPAAPLVFETIRRHRPTIFFAVPTGFANSLAWTGADFSSIRVCVSAGEPLGGSLLDRWRSRTGTEILEVYGSTELTHATISNELGRPRADTCGRLVAGCEARIVDERGCDVPDGKGGRLLIRSPASSRSYWRRPALSRRTFVKGWTVTGDVFSRDAEGWFHFHGRVDGMLKVGGQWVSPAQVEAVIRRHPAVARCRVGGAEGEDRLVRLHAELTLRSDYPDSAAVALEIRRLLRSELPAYKWPRDLSFANSEEEGTRAG
jgi:benzoate-CoA ligase family protein